MFVYRVAKCCRNNIYEKNFKTVFKNDQAFVEIPIFPNEHQVKVAMFMPSTFVKLRLSNKPEFFESVFFLNFSDE